MTAPLFTPLSFGPVTVPNRIAVAPMCQYSADDGCASDWHMHHLPTMAMSGAGLIMVEASAVERRGRISHGCLGIYSDANEHALARALSVCRKVAPPGTAFGIQLAHAGRKGSTRRPWEGGLPLGKDEDPWLTCAPSALPFDDGWHTPEELDRDGIERIRDAFVTAANRAVRAGFDVLELHYAHGYLMHQFLSPLTNKRNDRYGGDQDGRMTLPLEIAEAVISEVPDHVAVAARISGSDYAEDGLNENDAVTFARRLKALGVRYVCLTSLGLLPKVRIKIEPNYQVPFARKVKAEAGIVTRAVGLIMTPEQANDIIANGDADAVALGRGMLDDPRWPWHAAVRLGAEIKVPPQYERAGQKLWPGSAMLHGTNAA